MRTSVLHTRERASLDIDLRVLPTQFFAAKPLTGEERLCVAVLEDALTTYQKAVRSVAGHARYEERELADWFAANDFAFPFTFARICEALKLEADDIRRRLARWRDSGLPEKKPYKAGRATSHQKVVLMRAGA